MGQFEQWRVHDAAKKEWKDLPSNGRQGLAELMRRLKSGEELLPREQANYGGGLCGLKYSEARNEFRCYFGVDGKYSQCLVAVEFVYKKTEKAQLERARKRLDEWHAEGEARRPHDGGGR